jgi:C4-dicarboxylate-specific signal transduction histidine kinase
MRTFVKMLPEDDREDFQEVVADVEEGLERVVQIVQDLRSFAVKDKVQYQEVNLANVVATSARLLGNRLSRISFESTVSDSLVIEGNSNQLCQVFVNFFQNALDALSEMDRENEDGFLKVSCESNEDWISIHFRDNGCGISEENREKIFDPFFTSKEVGHGMGLGLSICYRILNQHGVKMELESEVGKGTHFTLSFPVVLDDSSFREEVVPEITANLEKIPV